MLITLEGLDGSGKTTVQRALRERRPGATFTREPTGTWYGDAVRRSVDDPSADPLAELFLYTADHAAHLAETVRPALAAGGTVISDRYSDSRFAYQGATLARADVGIDRPMAYVRDLHEPFSRPPDATLYLDVDPATAAERAGATDKFERRTHLAAVRENYERLIDAEPDRFRRIDATRSREAVVEEAVAVVDRLLDGD